MKYGVDMTYPPTTDQAQQMAGLGWSVCFVYVGGPRAAAHGAWQNGACAPLAGIFEGFVPCYVGRNVPWDTAYDFWRRGKNDADDADNLTGACGFGPLSPLVLDVEYGTWQKYPDPVRAYCRAFVFRVQSMNPNRMVYLYSDAVTCQNLADVFSGAMMAWWVWTGQTDPQAPVGSFDPSLPPPSAAWQFGGGSVAGVSVDFDSYADDFPLAEYGV